jgi:hypothetical protein
MTEAEWLGCTDNRVLLGVSLEHASMRKGRLFACACCRRIWAALDGLASEGPLVRRAVEVAEALTERLASSEEVERFIREANGHRTYDFGNGHDHVNVALSLVHEDTPVVMGIAASYSLFLGHGQQWGRASQCDLLRDLFPYRLPSIPPQCLRPEVVQLAQVAYQERLLPSSELDSACLTILADALEEAGCTDQALLSHLRTPGFHVRGCWAVDLILAKE